MCYEHIIIIMTLVLSLGGQRRDSFAFFTDLHAKQPVAIFFSSSSPNRSIGWIELDRVVYAGGLVADGALDSAFSDACVTCMWWWWWWWW